MKDGEARVEQAVLIIPRISFLAAIVLAALSLFNSGTVLFLGGGGQRCHGLHQGGCHRGFQSHQRNILAGSDHGRLDGRPHNHLGRALLHILGQVARDLLRLHRLHVTVPAQGAAGRVKESGKVC